MIAAISDHLSRFAALVACAILVAMAGLICVEIFMRTVLDTSTFVLDEFVGYGVASMTFLSLGSALKSQVFIRVNLLLANLPERPRRVVEVASHLAGVLLFSFLTFYFLKIVARDFSRGTVSNSIAEVPLWIPEAIMAVGLIIFVLQFATLSIGYLRGAPIVHVQKEL
ncbi:MAG: TRAP transporter small permease [Alphaproteobacteria bacterium]|nr:TRAP transporter small permease [Alphaproteobacteria bacterium]